MNSAERDEEPRTNPARCGITRRYLLRADAFPLEENFS